MLFKTEHTKGLLVRYIRDNGLTPGNRLPGQKELSRLFGVSGTTIIAALKGLEADGVVDIRNRVGVYVTDPSANGHTGRCIGVVSKWPVYSPFQAIFKEDLEYALRREGCRVVCLWRSGSSYDDVRGFDEYPGLRRMMVSHELDGLIMVMQPLVSEIHDLAREMRIPIAGLFIDEMDSNNIFLDYAHMIRESVRLLKEQHFRLPGLVSVETERGAYHVKPYREAMAEYYPEVKTVPVGHFLTHDMNPLKSDLYDRIRQWVIDVDSLPGRERPDALIVMDDIYAQWVVEFMWRLNSRWRPEMMVLRNRQMPIGIAVQRCGSWMADASAMAELMVAKMLWMTRTGHLRFPRLFVKPEYITPSVPEGGYIPAWEKFENWHWGDAPPRKQILPPFHAKPALQKGLWNGEDDFSAVVNGGWCDDGLVFFADVTDADAENNNPDTELWKGDACEFYITSASPKPFAVGDRLQAVVAAPDENGNCRVAFYADNHEIPARYFRAAGRRTASGYAVTAFVPWEALGDGSKDMILRDGFRFNMYIDDFEGCIMSLNGKGDLNRNKEASPLLMPADGIIPGGRYDVSVREGCFRSMLIDRKENIEFDAGGPCTAILRDASGETIAGKAFPSGKICLPAPDRSFCNMDIVIAKDGSEFFRDRVGICAVDMAELDRALRHPGRPSERIFALGILNALECLRSPCSTDDAADELAWRLRQLAGEDISAAPGRLRFLNLMGDPSGLVQIGISRGGVKPGTVLFKHTGARPGYCTMTVQWGGIPVVYADIMCFDDAEGAREAVASFRHMRRREIPVYLPEADMVYAGRGFVWGDSLPPDMDPEHLVSVFDPLAPAHVVRVTPEQALEYSGAEAFAVRRGAKDSHVRMMRKAGLREITPEEAADFDGVVIRLGPDGPDVPLSGRAYDHALYGIPDDRIIACRGNVAAATSCAVPEMAAEVIKAIFECKPISGETVDRWRRMRLESLGGDLPELREQGRMVRTGDVHCHTFYSDGGSTPGTLLAEAIAGGMDFMILTDHDTVTGAVKLSKVLRDSALAYPFIIGCEFTINDAYHLNVFPLRTAIDRGRMKYPELIDAARRRGAVVMLNHPMTYGINLRNFWYRSLAGSGIDVVERNLGQREVWRRNGYEVGFLGSTDSHNGIFGHMDRSAFLLDEVTGGGIVSQVLAKRCAMVAPDLPDLVYGDEAVCRALRSALGDPELPEYHEKRLDKVFRDFDLRTFLAHKVDGHDSDHEWGWMGDPGEIIPEIPDRE